MPRGRPKMTEEEKIAAAKKRARLAAKAARMAGGVPLLGNAKASGRGKLPTASGVKSTTGKKKGMVRGKVRQSTGVSSDQSIATIAVSLLALESKVDQVNAQFGTSLTQMSNAFNALVDRVNAIAGKITSMSVSMFPSPTEVSDGPVKSNGVSHTETPAPAKKRGRPAKVVAEASEIKPVMTVPEAITSMVEPPAQEAPVQVKPVPITPVRTTPDFSHDAPAQPPYRGFIRDTAPVTPAASATHQEPLNLTPIVVPVEDMYTPGDSGDLGLE